MDGREKELTTNLTPGEFEARGLARSRYHDRLFKENKPRPTNDQFDEGWEAARLFYKPIPGPVADSRKEVIEKAKEWMRYVETSSDVDYSPETEALARAVTLLEEREKVAAGLAHEGADTL